MQVFIEVTRAWRETTPVCSGLTRLVCAGYSRRDSGASRERARITQRAQDGSVHMQLFSPPSSYPARSTLNISWTVNMDMEIEWVDDVIASLFPYILFIFTFWKCNIFTQTFKSMSPYQNISKSTLVCIYSGWIYMVSYFVIAGILYFCYLWTNWVDNCEAMTSSSLLYIFCYWLFQKWFVKNCATLQFCIFLINPIFIKCSLGSWNIVIFQLKGKSSPELP